MDWPSILVATGTLALAVATSWMAWEIVKDRKLRVIEKRLDEFYVPLITLFTTKARRSPDDIIEINNIIAGKRYLGGPKTLKHLPTEFRATIAIGTRRFRIAENYERWEKTLKILWEEAKELIKEYYKIGGIKEYTLPAEPEWMIEPGK